MTDFLKGTLKKEEKLKAVARVHWVYIISGLFWLISFSSIGYLLNDVIWSLFNLGNLIETKYPLIAWLFIALGGLVGFHFFSKYAATEIALTDQRLLCKTGIFFTKVQEIDLLEIRTEKLTHSVFKSFLKYGKVYIDSRFVGDIYLPAITNPYIFLKALHKARKHSFESMDDLEAVSAFSNSS